MPNGGDPIHANSVIRLPTSLCSLESGVRVHLEILAGLCELEDLFECVCPVDDVRFAGAPADGDVFDRFDREHDLVGLCGVMDVLVDETFLVELTEDKALSSGVEAE